MDGGVADTARANTPANTTVLTQAVSCCSTQRARAAPLLQAPKHGSRYRMDGGMAGTTC